MIVHQRQDLLGVFVGEAQSLADSFCHAHADFHVVVETDTVARLRGGLERRWLADIVEQSAPGQCWRRVCRQPFQHHERMNPHIPFRMKLRRLLDAFHRSDFGKDLLEEPRFIQQFERAAGSTFREQLRKLLANALRRNPHTGGRHCQREVWPEAREFDRSSMFTNRAECSRFDLESEARGESHRAHHAQFIFPETAIRLADGANDFRFEVGLSANVVEHFAAVVAHQQTVDGKVAPLHVLLRRFRINHAVRVAAIAIAHVRAEGRNLNFHSIAGNQDHTELCADGNALRKKCRYLFGRGVGGYVVIGRLAAEKQVAHTSAHKQRLITVAA